MKTLETVLQENPDLSSHGFLIKGISQEDFESMRRDLATKCGCEFAAALQFLEGVKPSQRIKPRRGSYVLKHLAERHQGAYISNGAMIAALLATGVPIRRRENSPNVDFGIGMRWFKQRIDEARNRPRWP